MRCKVELFHSIHQMKLIKANECAKKMDMDNKKNY